MRVAEVGTAPELRRVADLFAAIWQTSDEDAPLSPDLLKALSHIGGYVAGAWLDDALVGASVGLLADDGGRPGLHSHITGILPAARGRGVGRALKLHQRTWALERGMARITWTFDPLVRRNARFNLTKLGAVGAAYHPNFYGSMQDAINKDDESDRCEVVWDLAGPRAVAAAEGQWAEPDLDQLRDAGAVEVLVEGAGGQPEAHQSDAPLRLCWVPPDIVGLRALDRTQARAWRLALRGALGDALAHGLVATGVSKSGWYVLERPR
jgi:predicted GNAT superfamily acetyltransferase